MADSRHRDSNQSATDRTMISSFDPPLGIVSVLAILAVAINLRPAITAVGPITDVIQTDTGLSTTTMGVLASVPVVCMGIGSLVTPAVTRAIGMDRTVTSALVSLGAMILARSYLLTPGLWLGTIGIGVSIGVLNAVLPAIIKRDFPEKASSITGVYSGMLTLSAGLASGVVVPVTASRSWQWALAMWCVLIAVGLAAWAASVRGRLRMARSTQLMASSVPQEAIPEAPHSVGAPLPRLSVWRTPLAWVITFFMGLQSFLFYSFVQWLPSIEQSHGFSPAAAGLHMTLFQIAGLIATLAVTALQREKLDQRMAASLTSVTWIVGTLGLLWAPQAAPLWPILMGAASGASFYLALSFISTRTQSPRLASELSGMMQSIGYLIAAFGPAISGALAASMGWNAVLILIAIVASVILVLGWIAGAPRTLEEDHAHMVTAL